MRRVRLGGERVMCVSGGRGSGTGSYFHWMPISRHDVGFLLAVASRRWNSQLEALFTARGFPEVRASYGALLVPLFEEDGLRMGDLAQRARLSKQTVTTMARLLERDGLIERTQDATDKRATIIRLSVRGRKLRPVAEAVRAEMERALVKRLTRGGVDDLRAALTELADAG